MTRRVTEAEMEEIFGGAEGYVLGVAGEKGLGGREGREGRRERVARWFAGRLGWKVKS